LRVLLGADDAQAEHAGRVGQAQRIGQHVGMAVDGGHQALLVVDQHEHAASRVDGVVGRVDHGEAFPAVTVASARAFARASARDFGSGRAAAAGARASKAST